MPAAQRGECATPAVETRVGKVPYVVSPEPLELLALDTAFPARDAEGPAGQGYLELTGYWKPLRL